MAKDLRIGTQYCAAEQIDKEKLKTDSTTARNFVLKMEEIIENVTEAQINKIRLKLTNARLLYAYSQLYPAPAPYNRRGFVSEPAFVQPDKNCKEHIGFRGQLLCGRHRH